MDEEVKIEEKINEEAVAEQIPEEPIEAAEAIEEKDDVYRLDEMADEMEQSIVNVKKVFSQQTALIEYLEKDEASRFVSLTNELKMSNSNLENQAAIMSSRMNDLRNVVEACRNDENIKNVVNKLTSALGVFKQ